MRQKSPARVYRTGLSAIISCAIYRNQFVLPRAEAEFFGMPERDRPVRARRGVGKMIVMAFARGEMVGELAARHDRLAVACVRAGLVERDRVERGEHPDVRNNRHIVFRVTVAVRGNLHDDADVKMRAVLQDRQRVFRDLFAENPVAVAAGIRDCVEVACADAAAAAHAAFVIDGRYVPFAVGNCAVRALLDALAAAAAAGCVHDGLAVAVLLHFAGARAAAHADVFQRAAKAHVLVAFKVRKRDKNVRVHNRLSDLCKLHVLTAFDGHQRFVQTFKPVGDENLTAGGHAGKSVARRRFQMVQRIFAQAGVKRVAVGQKRSAAARVDDFAKRIGKIRPQEREVARLAEMHFDRDELILKIDGFDPRLFNELLQLFGQGMIEIRTHVGKINF